MAVSSPASKLLSNAMTFGLPFIMIPSHFRSWYTTSYCARSAFCELVFIGRCINRAGKSSDVAINLGNFGLTFLSHRVNSQHGMHRDKGTSDISKFVFKLFMTGIYNDTSMGIPDKISDLNKTKQAAVSQFADKKLVALSILDKFDSIQRCGFAHVFLNKYLIPGQKRASDFKRCSSCKWVVTW